MYYKVEISGVDTSKLKTLKSDETNELLRRAHEGDKQARNLLVESNLKLVLSAVQRFSNRGGNPDDLFQVGCIGLIKAIERFDINLGLKLSTYAFSLIVGEMRRFLRDSGMVKVTRRVRELAIIALKKKEQLQSQLNREPTVEEIAAAMGTPKEDVVLAMEAIMEPSSLNDSVYSDGRENICLMDQVQDKISESDWKHFPTGRKKYYPCAFLPAKHRWKSAVRLGSHRPRSHASKKGRCNESSSRCRMPVYRICPAA